jgi:tetratricopeptide (TPR) repeat protein
MASRSRIVVGLTAALVLVPAVFAPQAPGANDETAASGQSRPATASPPAATKEEVQAHIRNLGSTRYSDRRAAAAELRRIGADAFDALFLATEHADPEIAASARYLLRQITVRWAQSEDPPAVRRLLRNYAESADESREAVVLELAELPKREGLAALCRVVRYDRSPLISRKAALAVIWPNARDARRTPVNSDVIDRELGTSIRTSAAWLRQFQAQLREPAPAVAAWQRLIDEEAARLEQNSDETRAEVVIGLLWNLADIYRQLGNRASVAQVVDRIVRIDADDPEQVAVALLMWLVEEKSWDSIDDLLDRHRDRFTRSKRPMYSAAIARLKQGKKDVAEELAEQASKLDANDTFGSFEIAKYLEIQGQFAWAVREYHQAIDDQPVDAQESIIARVSLASMLHDHQSDKEAAELLAPLVKLVQSDPKAAALYEQVHRFGVGVPERKGLLAQYHYYLACQRHAEQDWAREREELELANRSDREDSDVLIAMYRVPESDEKWRADTRRKIADVARTFQQQIDAAPNYAPHYNQWAWLISNTEGDFQQAIRYSQRSLELNNNGESAEASYLDTLGRCYYAAGDYENAVKFQRQAVEKVGYLKTMQRQLELFEKALAEKQSGERGAQNASPPARGNQ